MLRRTHPTIHPELGHLRRRWVAGLLSLTFLAGACSSGDDSASDDAPIEDESTPTSEPATDDASATPAEDTVEATQQRSVLTTVQVRGELNCGVAGTVPGFSAPGPDGALAGFDVDFCRAVAAAVIGDADAVKIVPLTDDERFDAVANGEVDVLFRNTAWTQIHDVEAGMDFGPTTFFDGQQLMGAETDSFTAEAELAAIDGASVCVVADSDDEANLVAAADRERVEVTIEPVDTFDAAIDGLDTGDCDLVTTDGSALHAHRSAQGAENDWAIFPAVPFSKQPLGPAYGQNDSAFADAVDWVVYATIIADENGIDQANVDQAVAVPPSPELSRLLGRDGELQTAMALPADAFFQVISQVGGYDDIFERHLGPLGLTRAGTPNAPWNEGGLIYAPPTGPSADAPYPDPSSTP